MINIRPFKGLRANKNYFDKIVAHPYDVPSLNEIREAVKNNPLSFYRISRSEVDLEPGTDPHSDEVYKKARSNFDEFRQKGHLVRDDKPSFYLYRQAVEGFSQTGLIGAVNVDDFTSGKIKKHENTLTEKENDRARHIESLNAQTGPVFLACKSRQGFEEIIAAAGSNPAEYDLTTDDGVRHTFWVIDNDDMIKKITDEFRSVESLYIADGHHRARAASRVAEKMKNGTDRESDYIMSIIYSHTSLRILPYNRVVKDLNWMTPLEFIDRVKSYFTVEPADPNDKDGGFRPQKQKEIGMYVDGHWHLVKPKGKIVKKNDPVKSLDVAILQDYLLDKILFIANPRTDKRIEFFGGSKASASLKRAVDSGEFAAAFSMYPTSIDELMTVADFNLLMPPKSTWFDPKPRSGFVIHELD